MRGIKVLHVFSGSLDGGAGRGVLWLHNALMEQGIDSRILTNGFVPTNAVNVTSIRTGVIKSLQINFLRRLDNLPQSFYRNSRRGKFSSGLFGKDLSKIDSIYWADIIQLHWINDGFIDMKSIGKIKKRIIWTIRDMWPFTGGCHYSLGCERFKSGCGNCISLASGRKHDLSRLIYDRKKRFLGQNIYPVGISSWITEMTRESGLFKSTQISTIHNGVDLSLFKLEPKLEAREYFGLPKHHEVILCGAQNLFDEYKGFKYFFDSLKLIERSKFIVVLFGKQSNDLVERLINLNIKAKTVGFLSNKDELGRLYSSADVFVAPSIQEAFGKTVVESMACGTPVVAFNKTGHADIIEHKKDGYLAENSCAESLAEGIDWVLNHQSKGLFLNTDLQQSASKFSAEIAAKSYIDLYQKIIESELSAVKIK